ncbi:glycosyltransferase family 61 protein [Moelleriella libera RCEF 2490]|uniref:EGF domain-specific O-linked N-acetylglucosamine transferase n=1 Tax=Moelleriella libera RCEF 2490 TaxID=1081109 RepID=A0A167VI36_9HYPO|nr:glycosyltransferase family 61 protein [Moelleriella libera RCEF 2490]
MCYGHRAVFDESLHRFRLGCNLRPLTPDEVARGIPDAPEHLTRYWYETGPGAIVDATVLFDEVVPAEQSQITTIRLKREGEDNPRHSLMEIMSLSWSLDVLQISVDERGEPFITPKSGATTQVVIADEHEDGPYIDLWKLFAKMPIRRLKELNASEPMSDLIIPFAGGSNTLWQGDWENLMCQDSTLVKTFVSRALTFYDIATPTKDDPDVLVTYIRRANTRKLLDEDVLIQALREGILHMKLHVVDFATIPFGEQLKIIRRTDLLVGVHGAGLTHLMFLQPGASVIEILPEGLQHKGFRNLAQMLDISYFRAHTKMHGDASGDNQWQFGAVEMNQQKLVELVQYGVKSQYNKGKKSYDLL